MKDIGKNIKTIRQAKGMTQDAMAEALFVTRQTVSNYENGRSRPDLDMLLRISEVLETDVNTVIYGPAIPQSKKDSYKWLGISAGIFVAVTALYVALRILFPKGTVFGYQYSARLAVQLTLLPLMLFVFGWVLMHCLGLSCSLQQINSRKGNISRIVMLFVLVFFVVIPAPYIVFTAIAGYRSYVYHSVSMRFPYIPILQEAFQGILFLIDKVPFVYILLGSLCWILGLPSIKTKRADTTSEIK